VLRGWRRLAPWLLLAASACARGGSDEPVPTGDPVRVEVTNNYALPVEIYAVGSGVTRRLGTVHPGMGARFTIPQNITRSGSVELEARLAAERQTFRSGQLLLAPGTIVDFDVAPQLFNSTVTLRP
jgi:hypothetical protein